MTTPVFFRRASWSIPFFALWMGNPASAAQYGNFTYTDNGASMTITDFPENVGGAVVIPSSINGKPVANIGDSAFSACHSISSVTIPSSVTSIGFGAFYTCYALNTVTIPTSITSIGDLAFYECGLTSVTIPSGITKIGASTFQSCPSLTTVTLPASLTTIEQSAFVRCYKLRNLTIPASVTTLGSSAFSQCTSLTSIKIPASVASVGNNAFGSCSSLTSANFLGNAPSVGTGVFQSTASAFTVYYISGKLGFSSPTWIGYQAFPMNPLTGSATVITAQSAVLHGTANTTGLAGPVIFEYGTTSSYGNTASVAISPNNEVVWQDVNATISGLQAGLVYHFRLTATNGGIANSGADMVFSTAYFLTVNSLHGTVSGGGEYTPNIIATLTATQAPGYLFTGWTGDAMGTDNPLSVVMNSDKTISATFSPDTNDTDDDGLTNYQEIVEYDTNPTKKDTDNDGVKDSLDALPLVSTETLDSDHDGIGDNTETDDDNDGLSDLNELAVYGTNPKRADSDGDGLSDPAEIQTNLTNPNIADTDSDRLSDGTEVNTHGTNPKDGDSDDDGFLDGYEVFTGKLPLDPLSKPALVAEARTAIEFVFPAAIGKTYRIEASTDLVTWDTLESGIVGAGGQVQRFYSILNVPKRYFRVEEDAP